ncbi:MAG: hypothetical protein QM579_01755 [Desulfovibrio sp.]
MSKKSSHVQTEQGRTLTRTSLPRVTNLAAAATGFLPGISDAKERVEQCRPCIYLL